MHLPLILVGLSTIAWTLPVPVQENGQAAVTVPIISPSSTTIARSPGKRQPTHAPVSMYESVIGALAGNAADALKKRANGPGTSFDSLLCATLKALKGENPTLFTSLLQSCTSLIDSSSHGRMKALKERNVVVDFEAAGNGSGEAALAKS